MEYKIERHHRRKRIVITVAVTGEVTVKVGCFTTEKAIERAVEVNSVWIKKQQQYFEEIYHHRIIIRKEDVSNIKKQLFSQMKELTDKYAEIMGVNPKSIKITSANTRWGSCGADASICYSCRCVYLSQRCKEYIVIHELSHIKEHNHSKNFYTVLEKYMPDYKDAKKELDGYYIHIE